MTLKSHHFSITATLTTDFGLTSEGIGVMKGTIIKLCPQARIFDLCHAVEKYSIINGARLFENVRFFPPAIHIAVVDPGVGSNRLPVAIQTKRGDILIGPDNGVLMNAANFLNGVERAVRITKKLGELHCVFDGRDVFAYTGGLILAGASFESVGELIDTQSLTPSPLVDFESINITKRAKVVHINSYGSIVLNIRSKNLKTMQGATLNACYQDRQLTASVVSTFSDVGHGHPLICDDGFGRVCLAINQDSASKKLGVNVNSTLTLASA